VVLCCCCCCCAGAGRDDGIERVSASDELMDLVGSDATDEIGDSSMDLDPLRPESSTLQAGECKC
jgi:hypothetical protein